MTESVKELDGKNFDSVPSRAGENFAKSTSCHSKNVGRQTTECMGCLEYSSLSNWRSHSNQTYNHRGTRVLILGTEARAKEVLALLRKEACLEQSVEEAGQNVLFARLYYFTTKRWIEHAKTSDAPEFLFSIVDYFYNLYNRYVIANSASENKKIVRHWQLYQHLVCDRSNAGAMAPQTIALVMGIRAHTRFDLAEAICFACAQYQQNHNIEPDIELFQTSLFGKASDDAFRQASIEFMGSFVSASKNRFVLDKILYAFSWVWLPIFQGARKLAWKEAQHSLKSGITICRQKRQPVLKAGV